MGRKAGGVLGAQHCGSAQGKAAAAAAAAKPAESWRFHEMKPFRGRERCEGRWATGRRGRQECREEKGRVDGGIKGVARQGFRTHTLPRTRFPQGALDARNARMRVNTRGRCVRLRFAIFDRKKSRKANPISTISLSADPGFHLVRHLLRSCRIGWRGWEEGKKKK